MNSKGYPSRHLMLVVVYALILILPTPTVAKKKADRIRPTPTIPQYNRYDAPNYRDPNVKRACEDISSPMCKGMQYNQTIMPNLFNQNQDDAALEMHQFYPLVKVGCSPKLAMFLCTMYAPPCTVVGFIIPPCKSLCQSSRDGCKTLMERFGFPWPEKLDCDLFPEKKSGGLCIDLDIDPTAETSNTSSLPTSRPSQGPEVGLPQDNETYCYESASGRNHDILNEFCEVDLVMKVRIEEITSSLKGTTYLISERKRTLYKTAGLKKRDLKTMRFHAREIVAPDCCDVIKPGKDYLIMGYKEMKKLVISTIQVWSKETRNMANKFEDLVC